MLLSVSVYIYYDYTVFSSFHCRNHSWVSFQGFAEAYNDTFQLNKEEGQYIMHV